MQVRRRRRSLRVPESIDLVLSRSGENRFAHRRIPVADGVWRDAVGVRIAERAKPISLDRGVLTIRAATNVWATELSLLASSLVERLRERGVDVKELKFRVGTVEAPARPPERRVSQAVPQPLPLPRALATSVEGVADDELRHAIGEAARANLAWQAYTRPNEASQGARGPRSAGRGSDPPDRTSGASREGSRYSPEGDSRRRT